MPGLRVTVDGEDVVAWCTAGCFIGLPLETGVHQIVLQPRLSPVRRVLLGVGLLPLVAAGAASVVECRHQRRQD